MVDLEDIPDPISEWTCEHCMGNNQEEDAQCRLGRRNRNGADFTNLTTFNQDVYQTYLGDSFCNQNVSNYNLEQYGNFHDKVPEYAVPYEYEATEHHNQIPFNQNTPQQYPEWVHYNQGRFEYVVDQREKMHADPPYPAQYEHIASELDYTGTMPKLYHDQYNYDTKKINADKSTVKENLMSNHHDHKQQKKEKKKSPDQRDWMIGGRRDLGRIQGKTLLNSNYILIQQLLKS